MQEGSRNTLSRFMLQKLKVIAGLMGHLPPIAMQKYFATRPCTVIGQFSGRFVALLLRSAKIKISGD